jgi:hypothetical protein
LLSLVAHECGYSGKEIAEYMRKGPALITRHIKEKKEMKKDIELVLAKLKASRPNVNISSLTPLCLTEGGGIL